MGLRGVKGLILGAQEGFSLSCTSFPVGSTGFWPIPERRPISSHFLAAAVCWEPGARATKTGPSACQAQGRRDG